MVNVTMNKCLIPDEKLFESIENKMNFYENKLKEMLRKNKDDEFLQGGAFMIIPAIIGVVINLFAINNEVVNTVTSFGLRQKLLYHKGVKRLHVPNELDYDIDDERRRIQLFELLTNDELKGKQLQVYNSYTRPRRDQVDIQRCFYKLTSWYIEKKYGQRESNDNNIKMVIFNLFSNYLYLIALVTYFVLEDDTKKTEEKVAKVLLVFKYIYPNNHFFGQENEFAENLKLRKKNNNPTQKNIYPPTIEFSNENEYANELKLQRKPMNQLTKSNIYSISDVFTNENEYSNDATTRNKHVNHKPIKILSLTNKKINANNISLEKHDIIPLRTYPQTRSQTRKIREQERKHDIIPMRTRSQTKKYLLREDLIPPKTNWDEKSHMLWKRRDTGGGSRRKTKKSRNSRRKK